MKKSNVRESPIARDNLLITDVGGLLGSRHSDTNDVIISDTMLRSLAPPQLRPMIDHKK